jgi:hypothetical protein
MPMRPHPYTWVVTTFGQAIFMAAAREVAEPLGFDVAGATHDDGSYELQIEGTVGTMNVAAGHFESYVDDIDPPEDGTRYRMQIRFSPPSADEPRARMEVDPYDDNYAAWPVIGPLADALAANLGATEITGDPPLWVQEQLQAEEPPTPERVPFLALRGVMLFPGFASVVPFGRPASVEAIERMVARSRLRIALVIQRDPSREAPPVSIDDVWPIAIDARILKAVRQDEGFLVVLKGIARLHLRELEPNDDLASVLVAPVAPVARGANVAGHHDALRRFAKLDPIVLEQAGTSVVQRIDELDAGVVADLVAKASGDHELMMRALLTVDPAERASLVEAAIGRAE